MDQLRSLTGSTAQAYLAVLVIYYTIAAVLNSFMKAAESAAKTRLGQDPGGS